MKSELNKMETQENREYIYDKLILWVCDVYRKPIPLEL